MFAMSRALLAALTLLCFEVAQVDWAVASDHWDSPVTRGEQSSDLTDLFAFPVPCGRLVVIMTVHPYSSPPTLLDVADQHGTSMPLPDPFPGIESGPVVKQPGTQFSDVVEYVFRIRPAYITGARKDVRIDVANDKELTISCKFDDAINQRMKCVARSKIGDELHEAVLNADVDVTSDTQHEALRLFAGARADPFFANPGRIINKNFPSRKEDVKVILRDRDASQMPDNAWGAVLLPVKNANVLSIVAEFDVSFFFPNDTVTLLAVAAETRKGKARLDRIGRPVVGNFLLSQHIDFHFLTSEQEALRDSWNRDDPFRRIGVNSLGLRDARYFNAMADTIALFDSADGSQSSDGVVDWGDRDTWLQLFLNDFLVIDASMPLEIERDHSRRPDLSRHYLEIEEAHYLGKKHLGPGGRTLNEDVIDTIMTILINGPNRMPPAGPLRHDGPAAQRPSKLSRPQFPYLPAPHTHLSEDSDD